MNRKVNQNLISAPEIVKRFGVTYQAVNHYTNLGLLEVAAKNGNARMYEKSQVRFRLSKIAQLVREGYSLRLIRKQLTGM